jgi:NAD(P)-dependent dehydrogenase (short-subunit alcohol dehydrogenase family)
MQWRILGHIWGHTQSNLLNDQGAITMAGRFSNKFALVAGGTGGLGRAVTLAFLQEGASVAVTFRKQEEFDALKESAGPQASSLTGHAVDVTNDAAVEKMVEGILSSQQRLDMLVNTVGGYKAGMKLWKQDSKDLDQMLDLNLRSGYALVRAVVPAMLRQGGGAIVNVAAKAALDPPAGAAAYAASKAAAIAMMNSLAADLQGTGVRVNSVLPSIIDTEPNRKAMPNADFAKWAKPADIARVILFLCSDDAKVVHGASIPVQGV